VNSNIKITILGNTAAIPKRGTHLSAQLIQVNNESFLMDCGEGTQMQLINYGIKYSKIENIFISHLHGDHFFGLIGLVSTYHLLRREKPLRIYGPPALEKLLTTQLEAANTSLNYKLIFIGVETDSKKLIYESSNALVYAFPLEHSIPTHGYCFEQKQKARKVNPDFINEHNPSINDIKKVKAGGDYVTSTGEVILNKDITISSPRPLSYSYCSDTKYFEKLIEYNMGVSALYHECTFDISLQKKAEARFHSTASDAAKVALKANVGQLILGHFSSRYEDLEVLLLEAQDIFPHTILSEEGMELVLESGS
jgi:ribonuclease Z